MRASAWTYGWIMLIAVATTLPWPRAASAETEKPSIDAQTKVRVGERVLKAVATVELTLQYDKGEAPNLGGPAWGGRGRGMYYRGGFFAERFLDEERPMEQPGLALGADLLLMPDVQLHERFIRKIEARVGEKRVGGRIIAWMLHQPAALLKLDEPLLDLQPMVFDAAAKGPYLTATIGEDEAGFRINIGSPGEAVTVFSDGRRTRELSMPSLLLTAEGVGVGASFYSHLPVDESWKGSPLDWPAMTLSQREAAMAKLDGWASEGILRVTLNFRSPAKSGDDFGAMMRRRMGGRFDDESAAATEMHVPGVRVDGPYVLVLTALDAATTARLERVRVFDAQGESHEATFVATLRDYGALVAALHPPMPGELPPAFPGGLPGAGEDIRAYRDRLLLSAEVRIAGPQRISYLGHDRMTGYELGWRRMLYPSTTGGAAGAFLFDDAGKLVALPLARRPRASMEGRYQDDEPVLTPAAHLAPVMRNLADHADPNIVPLSEEEENRLAWMGVVLQPLDQDLARLNEVSDLTNDGETGGLVTFVYPGSPAANAGIEPGQILLRLHVEDYPRPINIQLNEGFAGFVFPWDQLDQIPEQYFDQIPVPWPSAENELNTTLTDIGFGKPYEAEFIVDGQPRKVKFAVEESPRHYASAPKFEAEGLGLTVKDVTYEVRQYLRMSEDDPGVIVSRIEPGSGASVAGIKPYELITHVAGQPVKDVEAFETLAGDEGELKLSVKRMTRSREVVVRGR